MLLLQSNQIGHKDQNPRTLEQSPQDNTMSSHWALQMCILHDDERSALLGVYPQTAKVQCSPSPTTPKGCTKRRLCFRSKINPLPSQAHQSQLPVSCCIWHYKRFGVWLNQTWRCDPQKCFKDSPSKVKFLDAAAFLKMSFRSLQGVSHLNLKI